MKKKYEDYAGRPVDRALAKDLFRLAMPILFYAPVYLAWFIYIERHQFAHYTVIHTALDDMIPFCEIFVIPYYAWFVYISFVVLYLMFTLDIEEYYKCFFFLATGMTVFLVISTVFPNMHNLRPVVMPRDNIFTHLVSFIYKSDTASNLWPSIHVYNSIGAMIAMHRSSRFGKRAVRIGDFIGVSIILSTMFIKQHSVYDVTTAFIMAIMFYMFIYHTSLLENFCVKQERRVAIKYNS